MASANLSGTIVNNGAYIDRFTNAMWAVKKARRIQMVIGIMSRENGELLFQQYKKRPLPPFFDSVFGEVGGIILSVAKAGEDVRHWATSVGKHKALLSEIRNRAVLRSKAAHAEYIEARREVGRKWAEGA